MTREVGVNSCCVSPASALARATPLALVLGSFVVKEVSHGNYLVALAQTLLVAAANGLLGVIAGALVLAAVTAASRLRG